MRGLCNSGTYEYIYEVAGPGGSLAASSRTVVVQGAAELQLFVSGGQQLLDQILSGIGLLDLSTAIALEARNMGLGEVDPAQVLITDASLAAGGMILLTVRVPMAETARPEMRRSLSQEADAQPSGDGRNDSRGGGFAIAVVQQPEVVSRGQQTVQLKLATLEADIEDLAAMAEASAAAIDAMTTALPSISGGRPGTGEGQEEIASLYNSLLFDANAYHDSVEKGGQQVLRAAEVSLQQQLALLQSMQEATERLQDASDSVASKAMLMYTLGQADAFVGVLDGFGDQDSVVAACRMTENGGVYVGEFSVSSQGSIPAGIGRRSLLVAGGTAGSAKTSGEKEAIEDMVTRDKVPLAIKAVANALNSKSWRLLQGFAADRSIERLPSPLEGMTASSHLAEGVLLHLERKVRPRRSRDQHHDIHTAALGGC